MKPFLSLLRTHALFILGGVLSAVYLGGLTWFRGLPESAHWREMPANTFGDALAGVAGPLALLWLVLGFLQQGKELRQNGEALQLQAAELRAAVDQHKEMVVTNRDALEFDIKKHEHAQLEADVASRPRFRTTVPTLQSDPYNMSRMIWTATATLEIANCYDVKVFSNREGMENEVLSGMMLVGRGFDFHWEPKPTEGAFPQEVALYVLFKDLKNRQLVQVLKWERDRNGLPVLSALEVSLSTEDFARKMIADFQSKIEA